MTKNIKQIIIVSVIIIISFIGFKMFFANPESDSTITAENASNADFIDGQIIIALLDKLDQITLDESIFSSKAFISLQSFERNLEGQVLERKNPFLPIGVESSSSVSPRSTSTSISRP